ncbi:MAG: hypothetical protein AAF564_01980 [Bacteroidota bacterium]
MLYVVLIPAWLWALMLLAGWTTLAYRAYNQLNFRHPLMLSLLAVLMLQAIVASAGAFATSQYAIGQFACLTGIFGMWGSMGFTLIEAGVLVYLSRHWPRDADRKRRLLRSWTALWLVFKLVALLAHIRSAALCTV